MWRARAGIVFACVVAGIAVSLGTAATTVAAPSSSRGTSGTAQPSGYTIEVQRSSGGVVVPEGFVTVPAGGIQIFDFVPDDCYFITDVTVDDVSVGQITSYTFTNVQSDHLIYVGFGRQAFVITATASPGGKIFPCG